VRANSTDGSRLIPNQKASNLSQQYFELKVIGVSMNDTFVLTKVRKTSRFFEIKQAIEKLKGYKIE